MEWKWQNVLALTFVGIVLAAMTYVGLEKLFQIINALNHVPV